MLGVKKLKIVLCFNGCGKEIEAKQINAFCYDCKKKKRNESGRAEYKRNVVKSTKRKREYRNENLINYIFYASRGNAKRCNYVSIADWMTLGQFTKWYLEQSQECVVCGTIEKLRVDHDHETGRPRGILCDRHNKAEGYLTSSEDAEALAKYMRENKLLN